MMYLPLFRGKKATKSSSSDSQSLSLTTAHLTNVCSSSPSSPPAMNHHMDWKLE
jgi:hypothetical protein